MIGVVASPSESVVVREFFELFKTPWEFYQNDQQYDVLLCAGEGKVPRNADKLVLIYAGRKLPLDDRLNIEVTPQKRRTQMLSHRGRRIPVYADSVTFREHVTGPLVDEQSRQSGVYLREVSGTLVYRIGYDLFREIRILLTEGQPAINAAIPAVELHIALLRDLLVASRVPLVEIPPIPDGYRFLACLSHDIDHSSIRQHLFDHTMFGFLYRAVLGSVFNLVRGRASFRNLLTNWTAVLKLPLVHLGLANDIWCEFSRYIELERGERSTFFVIPFKDCPGESAEGVAPSRRASPYGAADISAQVQELMAGGCEIGLHGIDAWLDSHKGRAELEEIRRITGMDQIGVRMHWLYFDTRSPLILEQAGADYDSTIGYNGTVGYRAGTTQAYKPLEATRLLELPLHVMDTALFYPSYLNLARDEARMRVDRIIDNAVQFGGCVIVNWHDRSFAPERLWGDFYVDLVDRLKNREAWFSTAAQTVSWFRKRRSAIFESVSWQSGEMRVKISVDMSGDVPDLQLRIHNGREPQQNIPICAVASDLAQEFRLTRTIDACVAIS